MEMEQKDKIITLAAEMFVDEGIKAVRMDDVAHRAGVSKRTLYELFGDKEELLFLALLHYFIEFENRAGEIYADAPNIIIEMLDITRYIINNSGTNWRVLNSLKRFYPATYIRLHNERSRLRGDQFRKKLEQGVEQGILDHRVNLDLAMMMIHYTATSMIQTKEEQVFPEGTSPQEALLEMTIYFLRGISSTKGVEIIDEYIKNQVKK